MLRTAFFSAVRTLIWLVICGGLGPWLNLPAAEPEPAVTAAIRAEVERLTAASTAFRRGDLDAAKLEYQKVAQATNVPRHFVEEARERVREIERRQAGLPVRDPAAFRLPRPAPVKPAVTLHVAADAQVNGTGSLEKPFASLEQARDAIRALKRKGPLPAGGVAVVVHGGDYAVTSTLTLNAADSGADGAPIAYRAASGEQPRLRGGVRLTQWHPLADPHLQSRLPEESRDKVWQTDLRSQGLDRPLPLRLGGFASGNGFSTHPAHELFFDGKALPLARGPNEGFLRIADVAVKDGTKGYDRAGSKVGQFSYGDDRPSRWVSEPDLLLYGYWFWDWADSYERVVKIDPARKLITLAEPFHTYGYALGAPFYAVNALSELDVPGEWYLDRASGTVLLYPPSDPAKAVIEISRLDRPLLALDQVSHVRFEGLTWELGSADAVQVRGGADCTFAGCTVRRCAGNGIEIEGGLRHVLLSCEIYSLGRGGALVTGGDRKTLTPGGHVVENCDIRELSRIDHTYTPAVLVNGVGARLRHNRFHEVLSSAMRVEGNDHVIEFNEIFNAVLESDDQGGADMFGNATYRGNVYRFNYWHDIGRRDHSGEQPKCGQAGIRLDDAISGTLIYGNVFERCSMGKLGFGGVQVHGGKDNVIDHNLFIDCAAAISFSHWPEPRWREFVKGALEAPAVDRRLYLERYPELASLAENANRNFVCRNVTVRCSELLRRASPSVQAFANHKLAEGQLTLKADNPLLQAAGFDDLPVQEIGLYSDELRR